MLFNIEIDTGAELVGYLTPDDPQTSGTVLVRADGVELWRGPADEPRPALISSGRHRTGLCGFRIGQAEIPELASLAELEVRCAQTGILIYRRGGGPFQERRMFQMETSLTPHKALDTLIAKHFRLSYLGAEKYGSETLQQTLQLQGASSVFISARINYPALSFLVDDQFEMVCEVQDPFEEMAARLLYLSQIGAGSAQMEGRDRIFFGRVLEVLEGVNIATPEAMARFVSRLDGAVAADLSNPLTRQLTTMRPGELCAGDAISAALRTLAGFTIVAPASAGGWLELALEETLNLPGRFVSSKEPSELAAFADALADTKAAKEILEFDLEVHARVETVFTETIKAQTRSA